MEPDPKLPQTACPNTAGGMYPNPAVYWNPSTTAAGTSDGGAGQYPPRVVFVMPGNEGQLQDFGVIRFTVPSQGGGVYQLIS